MICGIMGMVYGRLDLSMAGWCGDDDLMAFLSFWTAFEQALLCLLFIPSLLFLSGWLGWAAFY